MTTTTPAERRFVLSRIARTILPGQMIQVRQDKLEENIFYRVSLEFHAFRVIQMANAAHEPMPEGAEAQQAEMQRRSGAFQDAVAALDRALAEALRDQQGSPSGIPRAPGG
jgi:hypothetical protein